MNITHETVKPARGLGELVVVRYAPDDSSGTIVGITANAIFGSPLDPDIAGPAKMVAARLGGDVLAIARPGTAGSAAPESLQLRERFMRHGFIAVASEVTLLVRDVYGEEVAEALHFGRSLGGYAALLMALKQNAKEAAIMDTGSLSNMEAFLRVYGTVRYMFKTFVTDPWLDGQLGGIDFASAYDLTDVETHMCRVLKDEYEDASMASRAEIASLVDQSGGGLYQSLREALRTGSYEGVVKLGFPTDSFNLLPKRKARLNILAARYPGRIGFRVGGEFGPTHQTAALPPALGYLLSTSVGDMDPFIRHWR